MAYSFPRALPSPTVFAWLIDLEFAKRSDYLKVIASTRKFASEEEARFKVYTRERGPQNHFLTVMAHAAA